MKKSECVTVDAAAAAKLGLGRRRGEARGELGPRLGSKLRQRSSETPPPEVLHNEILNGVRFDSELGDCVSSGVLHDLDSWCFQKNDVGCGWFHFFICFYVVEFCLAYRLISYLQVHFTERTWLTSCVVWAPWSSSGSFSAAWPVPRRKRRELSSLDPQVL